jgi:hypothetical protein
MVDLNEGVCYCIHNAGDCGFLSTDLPAFRRDVWFIPGRILGEEPRRLIGVLKCEEEIVSRAEYYGEGHEGKCC